METLAAAAAAASVPTSVREWMARASAPDSSTPYVAQSVALAREIAARLAELSATVDASTLAGGLAAERIVVFVERPPGARIAEVQFRFAEPMGAGGAGDAPVADGAAQSGQRAVCAALGRALLEIFSQGRSSAWEAASSNSRASASAFGAQDVHRGQQPPAKRRALAPQAASNALLEMGMPASVCRLVHDLLEAEDEPCPSTAIASIEEALFDLTQMKSSPQKFLYDRTCPRRAMDDAGLFGTAETQLFGRDGEVNALLSVRDRVSNHCVGVRANDAAPNFLCEAVFLGGYAGCGKTSLLRYLEHACEEERWFVLRCNFKTQGGSHTILLGAFDAWFDECQSRGAELQMKTSFQRVCASIRETVDANMLSQMCELMPALTKVFPTARSNSLGNGPTSMDTVGAGKVYLQNLFHVLFKSLCSAECPVLFALDNLQLAESIVMDLLTDFVVLEGLIDFVSDDDSGQSRPQGLFIAGAYRSNEVEETGDLMNSIKLLKESERANVTLLPVGELQRDDVNNLLAAKLCLPRRYTRELAAVVQNKTRGNPFFVLQFLQTIVSNKMLSFSVRSRRWVFDCGVINVMSISDNVAGLLTASFNQLSRELMRTLKVVSLIGFQVEEATIEALDSSNDVLSFSMRSELERAVQAGIMEKAGSIYQFSHDIVHQTVHGLVPPNTRTLLHKTIGKSLLLASARILQGSSAIDPAIHLLAVDQINTFVTDGGSPSVEERSQFATSNALAAELAIDRQSFEQARSYVNVGISLLDAQHWETQYPLSLKLFEMSAAVGFMCGDYNITSIADRLREISHNAKTYDDTLNASSLMARLLCSVCQFEEARSNCSIVLANLGEPFVSEPSLGQVQSEIPVMQAALRNVTYDSMKRLPRMTAPQKIHAMHFMNLLCRCCVVSKPLLLPHVSMRMMRLTMEYGFTEDSIVGLATAGCSIFLFTEDYELANQLGQISEMLIEESPKKHTLRSRLCHELLIQVKGIKQSWHAVIDLFPDTYRSAKLAGDLENALICRLSYCHGNAWTGGVHLSNLLQQTADCIKEIYKCGQTQQLYKAMAVCNYCQLHIAEDINVEVETLSFDELVEIGENGNNRLLLWMVFMFQMASHFWYGQYTLVAEISSKYSAQQTSSKEKRMLEVIRVFYEGVAYLHLARQTRQEQWRAMGKLAVAKMQRFEAFMSKWNVENKSLLLQAELYYLEGDIATADVAYRASIKAAQEHKFINEEALAFELYGVFCIENGNADKGLEQLRTAIGKYKQWGASNKEADLELFIDSINQAQSSWRSPG